MENIDSLSSPEDDPREKSISGTIPGYIEEKQALGLLSKTSAYNRSVELNRFARFCKNAGVHEVQDIHKNIVIQYLKSLKVNQNTKNTIRQILAAYMDYLVDEGLVLENIVAIIQSPKNHEVPFDALTSSELDALFKKEAERNSKVTDRNLLIYSLLLNYCLRASEVAQIKTKDVQIDNGGDTLLIRRKGGKQMKLPINQDLKTKLIFWLEARENYINKKSDYLFISVRGAPLDRKKIYNIVRAGLTRAGIIKRKQGPHLLRHTGASFLASNGVNPAVIQELLGHSSLYTTQKYLHYIRQELERALNKIPPRGR